MVTLSVRHLGRREPLLADWSIDLPPDLNEGPEPLTLRRLIECIVRREVQNYHQRQNRQPFVHVLTNRQIDDAAARGKIDMGGREPGPAVDGDEAVGAALQAFEDGMYLVVIDEEPQKRLDAEVFVNSGSVVTFIKLTFLRGA